jgi:pSer/pThr/pTyr-binding forkhead associated (FHA) protein
VNGFIGRVTLFVLAGFMAGILTWFISDGSGLIHLPNSTAVPTGRDQINYEIIFMTWGASIAILLGLADILASGQTGQWLRVVGVGFLVGVLAGLLGGQLGMGFFGMLYSAKATNPFIFLGNVLARAIGWGFIGALAGTAPGWRKFNLRVVRNGLIGGLIGGLLGGATFEVIPYLTPGIGIGGVSRFLAFLITGGCIGLFIALVQELLKEAWIRIVVGRNEGREILIEKAQTRIGRSELSDIALYGDPNVAKNHAVLVVQANGSYVLHDVSQSPIGIRVNDQPVAGEMPLRSGDKIQIAGKLLVFYERLTRQRTAPTPRDVSRRPQSVAAYPPAAAPGMPVAAAPMGRSTTYSGTTFAPPSSRREITAEAHLVATTGPYTGTVFPVRNGATAGRDPQVEIALPADTKTSRAHARFVYENGSFTVEDQGSTNGTYVNGQRVTRQPLAAGDTVTIGTTAFRFE